MVLPLIFFWFIEKLYLESSIILYIKKSSVWYALYKKSFQEEVVWNWLNFKSYSLWFVFLWNFYKEVKYWLYEYFMY